MGYMEDYQKRMISVKNELRKLAEQLVKNGCTVYFSTGKNSHYFKAYKNGTQITVSFIEVPYRWNLSYDIKPSIKKGSSITIQEIGYNSNPSTLFSIERVLSEMKDSWFDVNFEELDYALNFLEKI